MSDSEAKPAVSEMTALSDIVHEGDSQNKYYVYLSDHAMSKYGENVYFSSQLAEDMTGVDKVVEIGTPIYSGDGYLDDNLIVILPYESVAAFNADKDALIEKINACAPQDGYGFKFGSVQSLGADKVWAKLKSVALSKDVDTEISEAFNNWKTNPYPLFNLAEALSNDTGFDVNVERVVTEIARTPGIDSYAFHEDEIEYKIVYSANPVNGDYDNNGILEINDAQNILSYVASSAAGTVDTLPIVSSAPENMDVDGDGKITIADAQYVLTYCAQSAAGLNPTWDDILK